MSLTDTEKHSTKYLLLLLKKYTPISCSEYDSSLQVVRDNVSIPTFVAESLESWIDILGVESAGFQGLKLPITSSCILKNGSIRVNSPIKFCDWTYLLVSMEKTSGEETSYSDASPIGFLRFGHRSLFLSDPEADKILVRVNEAICALDFYLRQRRQGFGNFLMKQMISYLSIQSPCQIAFDKPTDAMISFLLKNFNLQSPIHQANNYVIFSGFFSFVPDHGWLSLTRQSWADFSALLSKPIKVINSSKWIGFFIQILEYIF